MGFCRPGTVPSFVLTSWPHKYLFNLILHHFWDPCISILNYGKISSYHSGMKFFLNNDFFIHTPAFSHNIGPLFLSLIGSLCTSSSYSTKEQAEISRNLKQPKGSVHCKCLQGFRGSSVISMKKGCKNYRETLQYLQIVGKSCSFSDIKL